MISNGERIVFLAFFMSHIPITMLVDSQAALPRDIFPQFAVDIVHWYSNGDLFNDPLIREQPEWFRHIVFCEITMQLPFFFFATGMLWNRSNTLRLPGLLYGSHVATTMAPILGHFYFSTALTSSQRASLIAVYSPYLIIPLWLIAALLRGEPFPVVTSKGRRAE